MPPPTDSLRSSIQFCHESIQAEPDPEDKAELTKALQVMLKVQAKNMAEGQSGGGGGGQGPPPPPQMMEEPMPPGGEDPRALALLSQLGG